MQLVSLLYASAISSQFNDSDIQTIIDASKRNNRSAGITGLLCFNRKYFLQVLEGERNVVNQTFQRIIKDPKHEHIVMLDYRSIFQRLFADWDMGYVPETAKMMALYRKYSATEIFKPLDMAGESALQLLVQIRQDILQPD